MYEVLMAHLRECAKLDPSNNTYTEAADAIEELQQQVEHYHGCMNDWFDEAQEYKVAYRAEHDARITEAKRLWDAFYESNKKAVELTPLKIVLPEPPKGEKGTCNTLRWIPVTERLPKERINPNTHDFEYVLCATIWGDVRPFKYGTPIGSKDAHFWNGAGYVDAYITHWMPLPEPPDHIGDANEMVAEVEE